jgi:hypothetical protein
MDGIVSRGGRHAVMEHKTTSERIRDDADSYWSKLAMDHQVSTYVVGAESMGYAVSETLYDVLRKPMLRPLEATPEEMRKFKKDGTLYANQRARAETSDEYLDRLRAEVLNNLEDYYQRRWVPRSDDQIKDYMFDAWQTGKSIRDGQVAGRAPRNPDSCMRFGRCAFWNVCANGDDPYHSPDFEVLDDPHPELNHPAQAERG